jgi:hypothetical protein
LGYVAPSFFLVLAVAGVVSNAAGLGTIGTMFRPPVVGRLTFATSWITLGLGLSTVAATVAVARARVARPWQARASRALAAGVVPSVFAVVALAAVLLLAATKTPPAAPVAPQAAATTAPQGMPAPPAPPALPAGQAAPGAPEESPLPKLAIGLALAACLLAIQIIGVRRGMRALAAPIASTPAVPAPDGPPDVGREIARSLAAALVLLLVTVAVGQAYVLPQDNPPAQVALSWDSERTRELAERACMDCHSSETLWPWYAKIAPSSWLTGAHVRGGRGSFNLSEINNVPAQRMARLPDRVEDAILEGRMPPRDYRLLHPLASLSAEEKEQLIAGLKASLAAGGSAPGVPPAP